jgi:hypothetical protein
VIRAALALGVSALLVTASCTSEDIVLASVPNNGGTSTTAATGTRCLSSAECGEGAFCSKHHCTSEAGTCELFPANGCNGDEHPVCGCDGITYFNDCLRKYNGQEAGEIGACEVNAVVCDPAVPTACPAGAFCAVLNEHDSPDRDGCRTPALGHCWVVPQQCPSNAHSDQWHECDHGQEAPTCVSTCVAAQNKKPYVHATACQ